METLYEKIGEFGLYQRLIFLLTCICSFIVAPPVVISAFSEAIIDHRCYVPTCDDEDSLYQEDFLNFTVPPSQDGDKWSQCRSLSQVNQSNESCDPANFAAQSNITCHRWVYDRSEFASTTVSEFNLVCGHSWLRPLSTSMYHIGMLCGAITMGYVADRLGRKIAILICIMIFSISGLISSVATNYIVYLIMRSISGIGGVALFSISFVMAIEVVGLKWRTFCGMMIEPPFSIGEAMVGVIAYYVRNFRWLIAICYLLVLPTISYYWLMPESIRWLIAKGRKDEALKVVQKAARVNSLEVPKNIDDLFEKKEDHNNEKEGEVSLVKLISKPNIRKTTFVLFYCWIICTLAYYGISMTSTNLSGNIYVNFIATMLIEIPGYIFIYFALDRIGRRGSMSLTFFICGAACIIAGFLPENFEKVILTLNLIGKFGISAAFGGIFVFTAELYPTDYRGLGVGACSTCARIGGIIAPYIVTLNTVFDQLPILIFGGSSLLAAWAILLLPESFGLELPQTIEESEDFGKDQSFWYFTCCGEGKKKVTKGVH